MMVVSCGWSRHLRIYSTSTCLIVRQGARVFRTVFEAAANLLTAASIGVAHEGSETADMNVIIESRHVPVP